MMSEQQPLASDSRTNNAGSRSCRSLKLAWTDEDTGEQLTLSLRGGARMLRGLEQLGFQLVEGPADSAGAVGQPSGDLRRVT